MQVRGQKLADMRIYLHARAVDAGLARMGVDHVDSMLLLSCAFTPAFNGASGDRGDPRG